ncbi:MAG: alpha/beta hydrolase [Treponematales bacterium]
MTITIKGGRTFTATLVKNSSTAALLALLKEGPVTIQMHDYGNFEKVGGLGKTLPTNDERITTKSGDLILYQGNALVIYYAPNTWTFTRLGKIDDVTPEELKAALGEGDVTVTLSMPTDFVLIKDGTFTMGSPAPNAYLTVDSYVRDIVNHPAFDGFAELLLPRDNNTSYYNTQLSNVSSLMPYHQNVNPSDVVAVLNFMISEVNSGNKIFYDFYSKSQKQGDQAKENTGLFFFRGKPGAPFAIICPGGGFSYVGSLHEGFPIAHALSQHGYNAFVIRYRIGGERIACEDLAAAIGFIFENAASLNISTKGYSLWGGSAGARMAARLASDGTVSYGGKTLPRPGMVVIAYTGHTAWTRGDPPTFTIVGERDGIANPAVMERRVNEMKAAGIPTEFHKYRNVGHGFALGTGTSAEGWIDDAIAFWEKHN